MGTWHMQCTSLTIPSLASPQPIPTIHGSGCSCATLPIPHHCAVVDTEHPRTQAASAALCQRCGLSALSPRGCCPCCPPEAVCFTICEHQEEMKQWWRIPFSKALMVKNVLLGCLFHSKGKKEKKVGEGGGRRERNHLLFLEAPHPGSSPAPGKLLLSPALPCNWTVPAAPGLIGTRHRAHVQHDWHRGL